MPILPRGWHCQMMKYDIKLKGLHLTKGAPCTTLQRSMFFLFFFPKKTLEISIPMILNLPISHQRCISHIRPKIISHFLLIAKAFGYLCMSPALPYRRFGHSSMSAWSIKSQASSKQRHLPPLCILCGAHFTAMTSDLQVPEFYPRAPKLYACASQIQDIATEACNSTNSTGRKEMASNLMELKEQIETLANSIHDMLVESSFDEELPQTGSNSYKAALDKVVQSTQELFVKDVCGAEPKHLSEPIRNLWRDTQGLAVAYKAQISGGGTSAGSESTTVWNFIKDEAKGGCEGRTKQEARSKSGSYLSLLRWYPNLQPKQSIPQTRPFFQDLYQLSKDLIVCWQEDSKEDKKDVLAYRLDMVKSCCQSYAIFLSSQETDQHHLHACLQLAAIERRSQPWTTDIEVMCQLSNLNLERGIPALQALKTSLEKLIKSLDEQQKGFSWPTIRELAPDGLSSVLGPISEQTEGLARVWADSYVRLTTGQPQVIDSETLWYSHIGPATHCYLTTRHDSKAIFSQDLNGHVSGPHF